MQMFFELFSDGLILEGLILLVLIYFFVKYDMTILALPFIFIRSLFNDDKKDRGSNFGEIPTNLVSDETSDGFIESTENNDLENSQDLDKNNDAIGMVIGISVTLVSTFIVAVVLLWVWASISGEILGLNPPQALVTWEDEYRDLTGVNSLDGLDGTGISLCIVDSGINIDHPDLANMNLIGWNDVINSVDTPYDDDGHGTAMAGIIVADGGLNGVSKNVDLLVA